MGGWGEEVLFELELIGLKFQLFINQIRSYILVIYHKPSNFPINEIQNIYNKLPTKGSHIIS